MPAEKSPAFQFYPKDFLSDRKQMSMSLAEAGAYWRLCCHCWLEGSLPTNPQQLARLCGATVRQMRNMWPAIGQCFLEQDGVFVHKRLEREREKQAKFRRRASDGGKAKAAMKQDVSSDLAPAKPLLNPALRSPISNLLSPSPEIAAPLNLSVSEDISEKAGRFLERYPQIYAEERRGAVFRLKPVLHFMTACELVQGWPDEAWLELMFRTFCKLPASEKMAWPGTPAQFLHLAPSIDARLREAGV